MFIAPAFSGHLFWSADICISAGPVELSATVHPVSGELSWGWPDILGIGAMAGGWDEVKWLQRISLFVAA